MLFARKRWGDDEVILHVGDKHRDKVIEHAVRAGLNIANRDAEVQKFVAAERERQANPLTKDRSAFERDNFPLLERVSDAYEYRPSMGAKRAAARLAEAEQVEQTNRSRSR